MRKLRLAALPVLLIAATSQPAAALELFDRFIEFAQKHAPRKSAEEGGLTVSDRGGDTSDAASFIASMKALDYTALMPRGPFSFNKSNSAWLSTLNWVEVHHRDGETWLKKLDMIPVDPDNSSCRVEQARASH
jgi:hypothetical protein